MLSGLSSVYITYEFWHAAFLRVTKSAVFCVSTTIPHIPTWPQQACLGAGKQNHTHTHTCSTKFSKQFFLHFLLSLLTLCECDYSLSFRMTCFVKLLKYPFSVNFLRGQSNLMIICKSSYHCKQY